MEQLIKKTGATLAEVHAAGIAQAAHLQSGVASSGPVQPAWQLSHEDGSPCRLLLLASSLGNGHMRAASAIEAAVVSRSSATTVKILDFWSLMDGKVAWAGRTTYLRLAQEHPALFDRIYHLDQKTWRGILESREPPPCSFAEVMSLVPPTSLAQAPADAPHYPSDRLLLRLLCAVLAGHPRHTPGSGRLLRLALVNSAWERLAGRLAEAVEAFNPDVIVATQMNPAALLSWARKKRVMDIPTLAVPTDFGVHDFWIQSGVDRYCLAHDSIARLYGQNIGPDKSTVTGIPLMPGFRRPPSMQEARQVLRLDPEVPVVLVAGGGLGIGVDVVAQRLLACSLPLQVLAIAGQNSAARHALAALAANSGQRLRLWDWTERMELLIRAADVVVGKPGGLTVAEVLACGRPLIAARALGGQEGFNVRFLEMHGVGQLVPEDQLIGVLTDLLNDRLRLTRMQERAWQVGVRDGADRIAELAFALAGPRVRSGEKVR